MAQVLNEDYIAQIERTAEAEVAGATALEQLELLRIKYLGRRGQVARMMESIGTLAAQARPEAGRLANELKKRLTEMIERRSALICAAPSAFPAPKEIDVTLPGERLPIGTIHPISAAMEEVCQCMRQLGFQCAEGPDVEDEFHNFDGLNIGPNHPARDIGSNFYITDTMLLRSQTSTVQIRYMERHKPPIRIFAPGKVFRPDTVDASHYHTFHQVEGLWVDEGISFSHLKTVLFLFGRLILGENARMRLRPSFFPFTEPSAEIDFSCFVCGGQGCPTCARKGWVEMGGCGMVHPKVLEAVSIDSEKYTGFAFGIGIDRLVMARHGIDDIRLLFGNDLRFLRQF